MGPLAGAALIAGASLAGGMLTNASARKEADRNRGFQAYMSNTSHTREVADLRAAGLNPILSANSGASTPVGGQAPIIDAIGAGVTSAMDKMRLSKEMEKLDSDISVNTQIAKREQSTAKNLDAQFPGIKAESDTRALMLKKVQEGMGFINKAQKNFEQKPLKLKPR